MPSLIVLLGPTGIGKTELSLSLAEYFNTPILSSDSRQLYKDLVIGTAAPTEEELSRAKHYFVGTLELDQYYNAWEFEKEVMHTLDNLFPTHPTVLMTGGSMMYIDAVCKGIDLLPNVNNDIRKQLLDEFEEKGLEYFQQRLLELDPEYYQVVDLNNHKRVIHALEIILTSGKTYTSFRKNEIKQRPFKIIKIGLTRDREELYDRINKRVDIMMEKGLLEEARRMLPYRNHNSLNTVGYKELFQYFDGNWTLDFAIEKIKQNSRIYSRKQMTWFKRDESIQWFHPNHKDEIIQYIEQKIAE